MKMLLMILISLFPLCLCISIAGYIAGNGRGGWGWFLAFGLLMTYIIEVRVQHHSSVNKEGRK